MERRKEAEQQLMIDVLRSIRLTCEESLVIGALLLFRFACVNWLLIIAFAVTHCQSQGTCSCYALGRGGAIGDWRVLLYIWKPDWWVCQYRWAVSWNYRNPGTACKLRVTITKSFFFYFNTHVIEFHGFSISCVFKLLVSMALILAIPIGCNRNS